MPAVSAVPLGLLATAGTMAKDKRTYLGPVKEPPGYSRGVAAWLAERTPPAPEARERDGGPNKDH